jgi:hypothetical protein
MYWDKHEELILASFGKPLLLQGRGMNKRIVEKELSDGEKLYIVEPFIIRGEDGYKNFYGI